MKKRIICGIYKIVSPSNKVYIGSSKNMHRRHLEYKNLNCELQFKLYNSFLKYGFENHIIEVIEECLEEDLNCRERFWQEEYNVLDREKGLNLTLVECGDKRRTFSEEAKRKQGDKQRGGKNPGAVPVINVLTGEEYECTKCVAEEYGFSVVSFGSKLRGLVTNDTPFIYKHLYEDFLTGRFTNVNVIKERRKSWNIVNRETKEIFESLAKATANYTQFKYDTITDWLKYPEHNRSPFIYLKDYDPSEEYIANRTPRSTSKNKVIDKDSLIVYPSCKKASDTMGMNNTTFSTRIKFSPDKTSFMFLTKFLEENPNFDISLFTYF